MLSKRLLALAPIFVSLMLVGCTSSGEVAVDVDSTGMWKASGKWKFQKYELADEPLGTYIPAGNAETFDQSLQTIAFASPDQEELGSATKSLLFIPKNWLEEEDYSRKRDILAQSTYTLTVAQIQSEVNNYQDVQLSDMPNGFVPNTSQSSSITITITTNTGRVSAQTFATAYHSELLSQYPPASSTTTPRPYIPTDMNSVRSFVNSATSGASTAKVDISATTPMIALSSTQSGTYNSVQRGSSSQGLSTVGTANFSYQKPCTGCVLY